MNKAINKYISYLLFTVLMLATLSPMAQVVSANNSDHKTDVIITKVETDAEIKEMEIEDLEFGIGSLEDWFGTTAEPLEGIYFTYYKVDDLDAVSSYTTPDAMEAAGYTNGVEVGPTKANGQVTLEQLENGLYWVVENPNSLVTGSKAVPFGLELPFTNSAGDGYLETIHVYPKNTVTREEPEIEKEVDKEINEIGEIHTWTVGIDLPEKGIGSYEELGFIDEIDSRLDWVGNVKLEIPGGATLTEGTHYTVNYAEGGTGVYEPQVGKEITGTLTVEFEEAGLAFLEAEKATRVETTFDTKINDTAEINQDIPNRPGLTFDNGIGNFAKPGDPDNPPKTPEDPDPTVKTLGVKVIKVDSMDSSEVLEGAEFILRNNNNKYATFEKGNDGVYVLTGWVDNDTQATRLVTDTDGQFTIKGLTESELNNEIYTLIETKAPNGYALPSGLEVTVNVDETTHLESHETTIENVKMTIPQTGGIGTILFTLVGGVIILFSVIFYRRTQTN